MLSPHMSLGKLLFLTHMLPVVVAGLAGWYLITPGESTPAAYIGFLLTCGLAGAGISIWRLTRGLDRLAAADGAVEPTGILELDSVSARLEGRRQQDRQQWEAVETLWEQLAPLGTSHPGFEEKRSCGVLLARVLGETARSAATNMGRVSRLSEQVSQSTVHTLAAARKQSAVLGRTISSVEEFSSQIDLVAGHAAAADQAALTVHELTVLGKDLVSRLADGMQCIGTNVAAGEQRVLALGERLKEISSIVEAIAAISGRTDMLALNAAIEAVRAGQEGRGFAVVAEEVRRLADHTANASREIADLVEAMQTETRETIGRMAEEHSLVQSETGRVREAGKLLEQIHQTSSGLAERVRGIALTAEEQIRGTHDLVQRLAELSELTDGIHQRSEAVRENAAELDVAAHDLEDRVSPLYRCDLGLTTAEFGFVWNELRRGPGTVEQVKGGRREQENEDRRSTSTTPCGPPASSERESPLMIGRP